MGGFDVLGEAGSGAQAISAACDLGPDVVLLDVQLPGRWVVLIARLLTQTGDEPCVVLCSVRAAQDYGRSGDQCGATGFLTKGGPVC